MSIKQTAAAILAKTSNAWSDEKQALRLINATLKTLNPVLIEQINNTGKADIPGVGQLRIHALPEQPNRHPLSGAKIKVPARKGIEFIADRKLKEAL